MSNRWDIGAVLALLVGVLAGPVAVRGAAAQAPPAEPLPPPGAAAPAERAPLGLEATPPRVSFIGGEVAFWRPGAADWAPARVNTPLAPGDLLYTGPSGNVEVQIGSRAFARAAPGTHVGLENLEPDFVQFRLTAGQFSLDLRDLPAGTTIELDTPHAVFTVERTGYYRANVGPTATTFITRRGGRATVTTAGGAPVTLAPSEHVVITGTDAPQVETYVAPDLSEWDRWNYARTDYLLEAVSARYVPAGIYGVRDLDRYGTWRVTQDYGAVWVPDAMPPGWAPYSHGRWMWDPHYGWTWIDDAPWGWAPYHHGRWVFARGFWAWAPGPIVVRPIYAPALVAFFGGPAVGRPLAWVALGWGEPCVPWWGPRGFAGAAWWGGWGGPRVVNRVVVQRTTVVNVQNITVYQNATVANAVIAVPHERFGRAPVASARVARVNVHDLEPVRGPLDVRPVPASLVPATGTAVRPPEAVQRRPVVATRSPREVSTSPVETPATRPGVASSPPPRLVPAPPRPDATTAPVRPPFGQQSAPERPRPPEPPRLEGPARTTPPRVEGRPAPATPRPASPVPAPAPSPPSQVTPPQPGRAPGGASPRVDGPPREKRALPGEPANRLFPGQGAGRVERPDTPPSAPAPATPPRRVEPPAASAPQPRIEPPAPAMPQPRIEPPAPATPRSRLEPPAPVTPQRRAEPPAPAMPQRRVEPSAPVTPQRRVELPAAATPQRRVEPPAAATPQPRIEPPAPAMPQRRVEPSAPVTPQRRGEPSAPATPGSTPDAGGPRGGGRN